MSTLSSRERPFLVQPMGSGLLGVTLRFAEEIRSEADYFSEISAMKLPAEMVKLAQHIIRKPSRQISIHPCWKIITAAGSCASFARNSRNVLPTRLRLSRRRRMLSVLWIRSGAASSPRKSAKPAPRRGAKAAAQKRRTCPQSGLP